MHIAPDETDTLAHIPAELLFPAPLAPPGHVLLGYDEHGRCPMLVDDTCSIYEHRPQACRTYDCRIFAATGVEVEADKPAIALRARQWRFGLPTQDDRADLAAVRAAARFVEAGGRRADGTAPTTATQRAVAAIELHEQFRPEQPDRGLG